jgi:hypothetical protein
MYTGTIFQSVLPFLVFFFVFSSSSGSASVLFEFFHAKKAAAPHRHPHLCGQHCGK